MNPFALRLKRLRKASPKAVYTFRQRVKRLRAYLELYSFPTPPPSEPALDALYQLTGQLRRAWLNQKYARKWAPSLLRAAKKRLRKRKKLFHARYAELLLPIRKTLHLWEKRFPLSSTLKEEHSWQSQVEAWLQSLRTRLEAFPPPPYLPEQTHQLRILLRTWEKATEVCPLAETPPENLTKALGRARDIFLFLKWAEKKGLNPESLAQIQSRYQRWYEQALSSWWTWRSGWAS